MSVSVLDVLAGSRALEPLSAVEVDVLVASDVRVWCRDASLVRVLVSRTSATASDASARVRAMGREVERASEMFKVSSSPLSAAVTSLNRLGPADRARVFAPAAEAVFARLAETAAELGRTRVGVAQALSGAVLDVELAAARVTDPEAAAVLVQVAESLRARRDAVGGITEPGVPDQWLTERVDAACARVVAALSDAAFVVALPDGSGDVREPGLGVEELPSSELGDRSELLGLFDPAN